MASLVNSSQDGGYVETGQRGSPAFDSSTSLVRRGSYFGAFLYMWSGIPWLAFFCVAMMMDAL
jgi:hypothetical protein